MQVQTNPTPEVTELKDDPRFLHIQLPPHLSADQLKALWEKKLRWRPTLRQWLAQVGGTVHTTWPADLDQTVMGYVAA